MVQGNQWLLRNSNSSGFADIPAFTYGGSTDTPRVWGTDISSLIFDEGSRQQPAAQQDPEPTRRILNSEAASFGGLSSDLFGQAMDELEDDLLNDLALARGG